MSLDAAKIGKNLRRQASRAGIVLLALTLASCAGSSDPWWDTQYDYRDHASASSRSNTSGPVARPRARPQTTTASVRNRATPVARPRATTPRSPGPRSSGNIAARTHVVKPGETVYRISSMYKVGQGELKSANGIGPDNSLRVGQRLSIPGSQSRNTRVAAAPARPSTGAGAPTPRSKPPLATPPPATGDFIWPVEGRIVSRFGPKADGLHNDGINIAVPEGSPVRAAQTGVVAYAGNELRGYGNLLLVRHSNGWMTAYAHNGELLVQRGATVTKGQTIALAGRTGSVQTAQVHFEIRRGSQALDPIKAMSS